MPEAERLPHLARFEILLPRREYLVVQIDDHLWDPVAYAPAAAKLLGGAEERCLAQNDPAMIDALTHTAVDRIAAENDRVSARLQREMRCAGAHEEAAVLLGAFALREAESAFADPRRLISRMTAHLALARAVDSRPPTTAGRLAGAILLTLVGRQQSAVDAIVALEKDAAVRGLAAWVRALRVRNTGDWRLLVNVAEPTALEQRERIRAMDMALGDDDALEILAEADDGTAADWPRVALNNAGVAAGNRYADAGLVRELHEIVSAREALGFEGSLNGSDDLARALNVEPAPGPVGAEPPVVRVLDWGMWASASQRHLLRAVVAKQWHLAASLGSKSDAAEFRAFSREHFAGLRLYPLAARYTGGSKEVYYAAMAQAIEICRTRPELVTDAVWKRLLEKTEDGPVPDEMPPNAEWFKPYFPVGTAFDPHWRPLALNRLPRLTYDDLGVIRQRAPYVRSLIDAAVKYHAKGGPTYDELQKEYGHLAAYDVYAARKIANAARNDPPRYLERYLELMEAVAKMKPEVLAEVGSYLADRGRDEEARRAYERYVATSRSQVGVSGSSWWLVRHYFLRGQQARATALADAAAGVYSETGLITRADLHDWRGETRQAEEFYLRAARRYDDPSDLLGFYLRHRRRGEEPARLLRSVFPEGFTRVSFPSLTSAPADGVVLEEVGCAGEREGVRKGDIVIAVDGIRVRNYRQYRAARAAGTGDEMRLTVWRNGRSLEVATELRYNWTESSLKNHDVSAGAPVAPAMGVDRRDRRVPVTVY